MLEQWLFSEIWVDMTCCSIESWGDVASKALVSPPWLLTAEASVGWMGGSCEVGVGIWAREWQDPVKTVTACWRGFMLTVIRLSWIDPLTGVSLNLGEKGTLRLSLFPVTVAAAAAFAMMPLSPVVELVGPWSLTDDGWVSIVVDSSLPRLDVEPLFFVEAGPLASDFVGL